jgi:hypothetical protein
MNTYLQCVKCGSTHFSDAEFRQYLAGRYSSVPGGELSTDTEAIRVRLCLCGHPASFNGQRGLSPREQQDFKLSIGRALQYRQETEPGYRERRLRESFANQDEYEALVRKVEHLSKLAKSRATPYGQKRSTKQSSAPPAD